MNLDRIPHSLRFAGEGFDSDSGDFGRWQRRSYGLFLFLLLSFLFHLVMLLLLRQWDAGRTVKNDFPEHSVELVDPRKLFPPDEKERNLLLGPADPSALREIPLGKETNLPPPRSTGPVVRAPKGGGGSGAPARGREGPRGGSGPIAPPAPPPPAAPLERSAVPPLIDPQPGPRADSPPLSGSDSDRPAASSPFPTAPDGGDAGRSASLPSLPPGGGGEISAGSSSVPGRPGGAAGGPGGAGGRRGFASEDAGLPGLLPGLPFADRKQLDQLAKVFSSKESAPQDPISINAHDLQLFSYFTKVKGRIEYIWTFPAAAARRGIQGDVLLHVTIHRDGRITDLSLVSSSGYDILDQEAMRAVQAASPLAPLPDSWRADQITVPFHFFYINEVIRVR